MEDKAIPWLPVVQHCVCMEGIYGKMVGKPFLSRPNSLKSTKQLEIINSDSTGLVTPKSLGGALYLLMFTDDYREFKIG